MVPCNDGMFDMGQLETVEMETGNGKWKWSKLDANES